MKKFIRHIFITFVTELITDDSILTQQVLQGDERAFEQLYRTLFLRLVNFAATYTENREDAEDVVQQSMLKFWTMIEQQQATDVRSVRAFLYQMVRNACLDYVKHNAIILENIVRGMDESVVESLCQWDLAPSADQETLYNELRQRVDNLLADMPERQREVFVLSREKQLKNQEIADQLGISLKAVEKHITASLKYLREHLSSVEFILFLLFL